MSLEKLPPSQLLHPSNLLSVSASYSVFLWQIALFVSSSDAVQPGWLLSFLRNVSAAQIREMQMNLVKYSRHFLYSHPAQPLGPEDLTWRMISGKLVNIKLHTRRSQRVVKESRSLCTCDCLRPNSTNPGLLL
nr:probable arabinosyltransferase ARAD1 [Ipomoea batatas]